jgi:hypothetical protein
MFIAESGKSCNTTLYQLAGPSEIAPVSAGDVVLLTAKNDGVTVNTLDGHYLGALQRRLGRRANQLMTGGNRYEAAVVGIEKTACQSFGVRLSKRLHCVMWSHFRLRSANRIAPIR